MQNNWTKEGGNCIRIGIQVKVKNFDQFLGFFIRSVGIPTFLR